MNVVMTGGGHFVEIQATAEGRAFTGSEMQDLLALAAAGIRRLTDEQRAVLPLKFSAHARKVASRFFESWKVERVLHFAAACGSILHSRRSYLGTDMCFS